MAAFRRWWALLLLAGALVPITLLEPYAAGPPIRDEAAAAHQWLGALLGAAPEINPAEHTAAQVLGAIALLALSWLLLSASHRLGASAAASNVALLVIVFGAGLFHAGTHDAAFAPIYSALGVAGLLWLGVCAAGRVAAIFLVVFVLLLVGVANVLVVMALALVWLFGFVWWGRAGAGPLVAAALAAGLALVVRKALAFPGREAFDWQGPEHTALLFSCERGLLPHAPVLLVVFLAGLAARPTRWAALAFGGIILVQVGVFGYWASGLRDFTPLMPLAVPLFACALAELPWWGRRAALLAAGLATFVALEIMVGRWVGSFPERGASAEAYGAHIMGERSLLAEVARWLRL